MVDQLLAGALHRLLAARELAVDLVQQIGRLEVESTERLDVQFGQVRVQTAREKLVVFVRMEASRRLDGALLLRIGRSTFEGRICIQIMVKLVVEQTLRTG